MAVQVFADGRLVYDNRLVLDPQHASYALLGLKTTAGLNKGGTLELIMRPGHPAYNTFNSYVTVVTLRENGALRFRGRALYPADDVYNCRTITCEGERCFLRDGIMRPYLYQDTPVAIFAAALEIYNGQVDAFKRFTLGRVTVTDANDYVRLESESAVTCADFFDKLVERCGGYITFNDDGNGGRAINWLAEINTASNQAIEFGENLLEFARSGQSPDLATVLVPYGAKLDDGTRITVESVNDGKDWIEDEEAIALRGRIVATHTWDDVTVPQNLLVKAQQWLSEHRLAITSLELTAIDLSKLDRTLDTFHIGDRVQVRSKPHGVDEPFQLTDRTTDWLNPEGGNITLGKTQTSLTGSDVSDYRDSLSTLEKVKHEITADYKNGIAAAIQEATLTLSSMIQQTSESIMLQVSEIYATNDEVTNLVQTQITQLASSIEFTFTQLQTKVEEIDGETRTTFAEWEKYIRFENGDIVLGEVGNEITLRIENDRISFLDGGAEVAYFSNKQLYITDAHFLNSLRVGRFAWLPRANGNLSLVKVGE